MTYPCFIYGYNKFKNDNLTQQTEDRGNGYGTLCRLWNDTITVKSIEVTHVTFFLTIIIICPLYSRCNELWNFSDL